VGIILYIGSITEEVGNKPRASIEEPKFVYYYGSSFIMAVGSFVLTELSGVFAVYLYITRHKQAHRKKMQALKVQQYNDRGPSTWRYRKPTRGGERDHYGAAPGGAAGAAAGSGYSTSSSRDRSQSRDRSREPSCSRSETFFTYTPVSDTSHELSNYTFPREGTDNTISTTAEMHGIPAAPPPPPPPPTVIVATPGGHTGTLGGASSYGTHSNRSETYYGTPSAPSIDIVRRTTPV
jgi:hypothetical protein